MFLVLVIIDVVCLSLIFVLACIIQKEATEYFRDRKK